MLDKLRKNWQALEQGEPGRRFQDFHERQKGSRPPWMRFLCLAAGGVLLALGPIAGLVPGPGGIVIFLLGALLLARELRAAAQALDWCELKVRKGWRSVQQAWRRLSSQR